MQHHYLVIWSAPIRQNSGSTVVLAGTKPSAINKAKVKLGNRVKKQHLHHFVACQKGHWSHETPTEGFTEAILHMAGILIGGTGG